MTNYKKVLGILLIVTGVFFFTIKTEREYINLVPNEGRDNTLILESDIEYRQRFTVSRTSLARIGLHLRSLSRTLPDVPIKIYVYRGDTVLASQNISPQFIDNEGATQVLISPAVPTMPGERLDIKVTAPKELSGQIGWQLRRQDGTFDAREVTLFVGEQANSDPGAYQAFHDSRPALAVQMGGLFLSLGFFIIFRNWFASRRNLTLFIYFLILSLLGIVPAILVKKLPLTLLLVEIAALWGMFLLLKRRGYHMVPSLFSANIFAFSTWFALHMESGRILLSLLAFLPFLFASDKSSIKSKVTRAMIVLGSALVILITSSTIYPPPEISGHVASFRDVFIDPNQALTANPIGTYSVTWSNFGSYIGIPAFLLAIMGIVRSSRRHIDLLLVGVLGLAISLVPVLSKFLYNYSVISPHYVILATLAFSFFAGAGLQALSNFWGQSKLSKFLVLAVYILSLLDVWHVSATVLEFI